MQSSLRQADQYAAFLFSAEGYERLWKKLCGWFVRSFAWAGSPGRCKDDVHTWSRKLFSEWCRWTGAWICPLTLLKLFTISVRPSEVVQKAAVQIYLLLYLAGMKPTKQQAAALYRRCSLFFYSSSVISFSKPQPSELQKSFGFLPFFLKSTAPHWGHFSFTGSYHDTKSQFG